MPTCEQCERPENAPLREQWGCDTAAEHPVYTTNCCSNPSCVDCKGTGERPIYRCPRAFVKESESCFVGIRSAFFAFTYLDRWGILPVSGGSIDQSASFHRFCMLMEDEKNFWKKKVEDKEAKRQKMERVAAAASNRSRERLGR